MRHFSNHCVAENKQEKVGHGSDQNGKLAVHARGSSFM